MLLITCVGFIVALLTIGICIGIKYIYFKLKKTPESDIVLGYSQIRDIFLIVKDPSEAYKGCNNDLDFNEIAFSKRDFEWNELIISFGDMGKISKY